MQKATFLATSNPEDLRGVTAIIICVPTPLDDLQEPDLSFLQEAGETITEILQPGQTIILESTTYPGTTREVLAPLLEKSGLRAGKDFYLAFSPERIDPGRTDYTIKTTPKLVGGIDEESTSRAAEVYRLVCDQVVELSGADAAELAKLLENVFRSVNIALMNEMAQLCEKMDVDIWEVVDAASTKPFGFMRFEPGPGMGGHCLPVDPFYLAYRARQYDFSPEFIELTGKINRSQPEFCVRRAADLLTKEGHDVRNAKVLLLGVAYKPGVADTRESPALQIMSSLEERGVQVSFHDPYVPELPGKKSRKLASALPEADLVLLVTAHEEFDLEDIVNNSRLLLDLRGATRFIDADHVSLL